MQKFWYFNEIYHLKFHDFFYRILDKILFTCNNLLYIRILTNNILLQSNICGAYVLMLVVFVFLLQVVKCCNARNGMQNNLNLNV